MRASTFARADVNSDGRLSKQEFESGLREKRAERRARKADKKAERRARRGKGKRKAERDDKGKRPRAFARIDQNGDGVVTQQESKAALKEMFERLDADGNGQITREERQQARDERRGRRGKGRRGGKHSN